jgi:hypothetical protein
VHNPCFFLLLPLLFLRQETLLQLVPPLCLDRPAGLRKIALAAQDVVLKNVWRDIVLRCRLPEIAKLGEKLWSLLLFGF